ncbi:CRAL/TRIO domain-containing protein [Besnoitia besnoiti]|uniref:CRAL/TRIO domain-containing protein n=1 Tax=Besnoitia besnoiti TaxID=94643 RepID=A0A2A9M7T5_BESBE|nr:CRAL/TRIO domain-containing protein [Besnoitia besnoiti]PFH34548.1 CRAL/TRIO domain-containing protein [Besnoitia besnoiti]
MMQEATVSPVPAAEACVDVSRETQAEPCQQNSSPSAAQTEGTIETVSVQTGPPPCLSTTPPRLGTLPGDLFSAEELQKVEELRRFIDTFPVEPSSPESGAAASAAVEATVEKSLSASSSSASSWFSWATAESSSGSGESAEKAVQAQATEITSLTWDELVWLDDDLLLSRYLRSYNWDQAEAQKQLLKTLSWRRVRKPHCIPPEEVVGTAQKGSIYRKGFDSRGRAIIYFKPGRDSGTSSNSSQQYILYTVERAMQSLDRLSGRDQLVFLLDFNGWGLSQLPKTEVSREIVSILNDHYTDVLAEAYIVNAPSYFDAIWRLVSLMVHPDTAKKVQFLHTSNAKDLARLREAIPPVYLETCVGGDCAFDYDHVAYWEEERRQFCEVMQAREKQLAALQASEKLQERIKANGQSS